VFKGERAHPPPLSAWRGGIRIHEG